MNAEDATGADWAHQQELENHERELVEERLFLVMVVLRLINRIETIEEELKRD